jgi:hypothetical protein
MSNATGPEPTNDTTPYSTPEGDIVVFAGERAPFRPSPLNQLADGTAVITAGLVDGIRMHGTPDEPRATFILISPTGQATYAALDTTTYDDVFGVVADSTKVHLRGICRRPFEDGPPYIQVTDAEPLFG